MLVMALHRRGKWDTGVCVQWWMGKIDESGGGWAGKPEAGMGRVLIGGGAEQGRDRWWYRASWIRREPGRWTGRVLEEERVWREMDG